MNYIIFDIEATCEKNKKDFQSEIIEIGAVKVNNSLKIIGEFSSFIMPVINPKLTDFCTELTTISQSNVEKADSFCNVIHKFLLWIGETDYTLCSWGFYDKMQLKKDCKFYNVDTAWINNHISLKHQHGNKVMGIKKGVGMQAALKNAGIKPNGIHHRGIDDAKNITQIFIKYFDLWDFN